MNLVYFNFKANVVVGRYLAPAISRWFPTAAPGFELGSGQVGYVVGKVTLGAGFLRVLWFLLPIFIPPNFPSSKPPGGK
jgi:hypothetical protein